MKWHDHTCPTCGKQFKATEYQIRYLELGWRKNIYCSANCANTANYKPAAALQEVLEFLIEFKRTHDGNTPLLDEIAAEFDFSKTSAHKYLRRLADAGHIKIISNGRILIPGGRWTHQSSIVNHQS